MYKQVEEMVKRVRLTPEETREELKKYYTDEQMLMPEEIHDIVCGVIAVVREAQLNKVLNDEDLALIDKNQTLDKFLKIVGKHYPEFLDVIVADNWKKVIPLAEELKKE